MPLGHFLDEVRVSAGRFRIPPREIEEMLPQQFKTETIQQLADVAERERAVLSRQVYESRLKQRPTAVKAVVRRNSPVNDSGAKTKLNPVEE